MEKQLPFIPLEKLTYKGLSGVQAARQKEQGHSNATPPPPGKSWWQIVASHLFTFFNLINAILALALLLVGSYQNMLFMGVVVCNTFIGTFQELRAKKTLDSLNLLVSPKALAVRDESPLWLHPEEIVVDDLIVLYQGDQIPVDGQVVGGMGAVNEALLTGESEPVEKKLNDLLLSGSFVIEGTLYMQVKKVGAQAYAAQVTLSAKTIKAPKSELMTDLSKLIKIMSAVLFPIGILLFLKQYFALHLPLTQAIPASVAAMIGMIPEGLMLLTSLALTVGVIRLSKKNALAQDIYALESLARVDVLCVDKTGTLTEGNMSVSDLVPFNNQEGRLDKAMSHLVGGLEDNNLTFKALRKHFNPTNHAHYSQVIPFSSARKYSGVREETQGSFAMGAPGYLFPQGLEQSFAGQIDAYIEQGYRVLLVAYSPNPFVEKNLPPGLEPLGLVLLYDKLKEDTKQTIDFFTKEGVHTCIISGDDPKTVGLIGKKLGLTGAAVDATTLTTNKALSQAAGRYQVFGRVSPEQKKLLVEVLKAQGHTVGMIGDGVNDVPALKACDCSIAMAGGSSAAGKTARLVLLDNRFFSLPAVVMEGRRVINNMARTASLFLVKTLFSALLAFLLLFLPMQYPFEPIQMTLISSLFVGIPSFFLALEPNKRPVRGNFLGKVLANALPGALTIVLLMLAIFGFSKTFGFSQNQEATLATWVTGTAYFWILFSICFPFTLMRGLLLGLVTAAFVVAMVLFPSLLGLVPMNLTMIVCTGALGLLAPFLLKWMRKVSKKLLPLFWKKKG